MSDVAPPGGTPDPGAEAAARIANAPGAPAAAFRVGEVMRDTWRIWLANVVWFVPVSVLLVAPTVAFYLFYLGHLPPPGTLPKPKMPWTYRMTLSTGFVVSAQIASGVFSAHVVQALQGRRAAFIDSVRRASRVLPALAAVSVLVGAAIGLGNQFCGVPGLIANAIFAVAAPVAVLEGSGVRMSIERSIQLTSGQRWATFWAQLAVSVPVWIVVLCEYAAVTILGHATTVATPHLSTGLALLTTTPLANGVTAVEASVIYFRLQRALEPNDAKRMARVFD